MEGVILPMCNVFNVFFNLRQGSDDLFSKMLIRLARLLNVVSDNPTHVQAQESIVVREDICKDFLHSYLSWLTQGLY